MTECSLLLRGHLHSKFGCTFDGGCSTGRKFDSGTYFPSFVGRSRQLFPRVHLASFGLMSRCSRSQCSGGLPTSGPSTDVSHSQGSPRRDCSGLTSRSPTKRPSSATTTTTSTASGPVRSLSISEPEEFPVKTQSARGRSRRAPAVGASRSMWATRRYLGHRQFQPFISSVGPWSPFPTTLRMLSVL